MDGKYIFAIVILGLFFLLILVSFAFLEYARKKEEKLQEWIKERYSNKDLSKLDYDTVPEDEVIPEPTVSEAVKEVIEGNEDTAEEQPDIEGTYGKIDVEGIEEITGNYDEKK